MFLQTSESSGSWLILDTHPDPLGNQDAPLILDVENVGKSTEIPTMIGGIEKDVQENLPDPRVCEVILKVTGELYECRVFHFAVFLLVSY